MRSNFSNGCLEPLPKCGDEMPACEGRTTRPLSKAESPFFGVSALPIRRRRRAVLQRASGCRDRRLDSDSLIAHKGCRSLPQNESIEESASGGAIEHAYAARGLHNRSGKP